MVIRNRLERDKRLRTGFAFQQRVRRKILDVFTRYFPDLSTDGIRSCDACLNGSDIILSPSWRKRIPVGIECKFKATNYNSIKKDWLQAVRHVERMESADPIYPVLSITGGHQLTFMVMEIDHWVEVFSELAQLREELEENKLRRIQE